MKLLSAIFLFSLAVVVYSSEEDAQDSDGESFCDEFCPDYFRKCPDVTSDHCGKNYFSIRCPRACGSCTPCDWASQHDMEAMLSSFNDFQGETDAMFEDMLSQLEDLVEDVLDNNELLSNMADQIEEINEKYSCSSDDDCNGHGTCSDSSCSCDSGYQGDFCNGDVDECSSNPCGDSQVCENNLGSYSCNCESGYYLSDDGSCQSSGVLNDEASQALKEFLPDGMSLGDRCFSLEEDGSNAYPNWFHYYCDDKGPTVTIVKAVESGWIFGGYTDISWSSDAQYRYSSQNTFLFTLYPIQEKLMSTSQNVYELYDWDYYGPTFGGGHNLYCGQSGSLWGYANSWSWSYEVPADTSYSISGTASSSSGSYTIESLEVFLVN